MVLVCLYCISDDNLIHFYYFLLFSYFSCFSYLQEIYFHVLLDGSFCAYKGKGSLNLGKTSSFISMNIENMASLCSHFDSSEICLLWVPPNHF